MNTLNPKSGTRGRYVVPTSMYADVLRPLIDRLNNYLDNDQGTGAVHLVGERAAVATGAKPEAIVRRMYDALYDKTLKTSASIADGVLLALDVDIEQTTIPTFPDGIRPAREMVDTYCDEVDGAPQMRLPERDALAKSLNHFCAGFLMGAGLDPEHILEVHAAKSVGRFLREGFKATPTEEQLELVGAVA